MTKGILLIDHGSRREAANEMMDCMANLVQALAGPDVIARYAHMELAEPSIEAGLRSCVEAGATDIVVFPYMLSPGKHSTGDIPRMVSAAATEWPHVAIRVTNAFGVHEKLAELILERAGLPVVHPLGSDDASHCWHTSHSGTACGDACRCLPVSGESADSSTRFARSE
ncbi:MAG: CbiX/SirB N-terminal domain-containing protein [Gemmatimonadaceae bacterium]